MQCGLGFKPVQGWFLLLVLPLCSSSGAAVTKTVQAAGWGVVVDGDLASAFEQAKRAALRQAVEEGVGTLVTAATQVQNFALIDDFILTQTAGFVRSYSILEKGMDQSHTYKVLLEAVVDLGKLHGQLDALAVLNEEMGNPRIICIGAKGEEAQGTSGESLAAGLVEQIGKAYPSFNLLGPTSATNLDSAQAIAKYKHGDILLWARVEIGRQAPIKIPFAKANLEQAGWRTATYKLSLELYWVDTGESIAHITETRQASDVGFSAATERAGAAALALGADKALARLAQDWRKKLFSGRTLRVIVRGKAPLRRLFETEFAATRGMIERLYPRTVSQGQTTYDARTKSGAYLLARQLSAVGIEGVDVEVLAVSANLLELHLSHPSTGEDGQL